MLYDELVSALYEPSGAIGQLISYLSGEDLDYPTNSQNLSVSTPRVKTAYGYTFTYFTTLVVIITFFVLAPTLQMFVFGYFNNFSTINIVWFTLEYFLGIYIMILILGSETIQKIFLYLIHYIQGFTLMALLMNCGLFLQTMFFWVRSIEFDKNRSQFAENAMDLASWELIQTVPTIVYLLIIYLYMVDIKAYYAQQGISIPTLTISTYTVTMTYWVTWAVTESNAQLAILYYYSYTVLFIYLNPIVWLT